MRKSDPKSLSYEALAEICAETRIEKWLLNSGCLSSAAALFLPVAALLIFRDFASPLFLGLALTASALFWTHHLVRRPKRRYREELAFRRGLGPWPQYVAEAEAILRQKEADWVLLFTLRSLPRGGFWWLRLALKEGPPVSARAYLRITPRTEDAFFTQVETDVPDGIAQDLMRLLRDLDLAALADVPPCVIDGAPCHVTLSRREPWRAASANCNLGGLNAELRQHPTAALCMKLADIAWRLSPGR